MTLSIILLVLLSAVLHAGWNAYAKKSDSPLVFLGWLQLLGSLGVIPLAAIGVLHDIPESVWWILVATGAVHTGYQIFLGKAYERGDLSVVYPISRSTPALVALVAGPLLNDPVSATGAVGIAIVMAGMWLVQTRGEIAWKAFIGPGVGFAYLTLLSTVGYSLLDKLAMANLEAATWTTAVPKSLAYFFLLALFSSVLFVPYVVWRAPGGSFWRFPKSNPSLLALGFVASFASYGLILEAMRTAPVSYVTAVRQTSVVFAALLSAVLLKESPGRARVVGTILTALGVAVIALWP